MTRAVNIVKSKRFLRAMQLVGLIAFGIFVLLFLLLRPGEATLRPTQPIETWDRTNIPFALRSSGRMLLVMRGNYYVEAWSGNAETNWSYSDVFSNTYTATPGNPWICDVVIPTEVTKHKVTVRAMQVSTLRARMADLLTDKSGRIYDPFPVLFWDVFMRLEPRYPDIEITSSTYIRTRSGWKEELPGTRDER